MGILNVTPDSFYDGGHFAAPSDAIRHGQKLMDEGADILDLGGQSTRPGSQPIGDREELDRVLPVLQGLRKHTNSWISVDTYRSKVARACLQEGADMINDVSAFRMDPEMAPLIAEFEVPVVCMHFLKSIHPMPPDPEYNDLLGEVSGFFEETFAMAKQEGVKREQIIVDPGIGFGKKLEHNLKLINELCFLQKFQRPILVGPSRKSFIGKITGESAQDRLDGSVAAAAACVLRGAQILRVHDVAPIRRVCDVLDAVVNS